MMEKIRILCYGDSNTYGFIPGRGGRYDQHTRWPGRLQKLLGGAYEVIEEGLCGRTTAFEDASEPGRCGLDGIRDAIERNRRLDLLIILLGSNDCKTQFGLSAQEIAEGLGRLLEKAGRAKDHSFRILLVAPAAMTERVIQSGFGSEFDRRSVEVSKELAREYKKLAQKYGCGFLDGTEVTKVSETDGLHLDVQGHRMLAEAVFDQFPLSSDSIQGE